MSDTLWVVEVKIGKVWSRIRSGVFPNREAARGCCREYNWSFDGQYRVRKYQRVEP